MRHVLAAIGSMAGSTLGLILMAGLGAAVPAAAQGLPPGFGAATGAGPGLLVDLRYAGPNNFVGTAIDGYERPRCILTRQAAEALAEVQIEIASSGAGLKVFDCYRPTRAVAHFTRWARDAKDVRTKGQYYPDLDKASLFREGYIASRSAHSRGSTVDLTLVDILPGPDGKLPEREMGTPFDYFSPLSWPSNQRVDEIAHRNRQILADAMKKHGFIPYSKEWWHFTLAREPFPDTYFDFPVK